MKKTALILLALALFCAPVRAMQFKAETNLYFNQNELVDEDLYAAGENVTFLGNALQDLYVAASNQATVSGTVVQDLNILAVDAEVTAKVGDDLRIFASGVKFAGNVAGSTMVLASRVTQQRQSLLEGDVAITGGEIRLSGTINGSLQVSAKEIILDGTLAGPVTLNADRIRLESGARVLGRLQYSSPQEIQIDLGALVQQPVQRVSAPAVTGAGAEPFDWKGLVWFGKFLYRLTLYLGLLAVGCLLLWLAPLPMRRYVDVIRLRPWPSLGWGVITVLGLAVVMGLLVVSLLGIPIAAIVAVLAFFAALFAAIGAGYTLGLLLLKPQPQALGKNLLAFFLGFTVLSVIQLIPVVGTLVDVLVILAGLGALWLLRTFQEPAPAVPVRPAPAKTQGPPSVAPPAPQTPVSTAAASSPKTAWKPSIPAFKKKGGGKPKAAQPRSKPRPAPRKKRKK